MRHIWVWLSALLVSAALTGCGGVSQKETEAAQEDQTHKIGVLVYNLADEEVMSFRSYLENYIMECFPDVEFYYSDSVSDEEGIQEFLALAHENGVEGIMSFLSYDLEEEVVACEEYEMYYLMASGTVAEDAFHAVEDSPRFLGVVGPGTEVEYQAGKEMAEYFMEETVGDSYLIYSGGAAQGNEMHRIRTQAILETLEEGYGVTFDMPAEELALTEEPVRLQSGSLEVGIYPGFVRLDGVREGAAKELDSGAYDSAMAVLPVGPLVEEARGSNIPLGTVDAYTEGNQTLFNSGDLNYVTGKYSSIIGPSFTAMYNAVKGYAEDFRQDGKAFQIQQGFWSSSSAEDYGEKYSLASAIYVNAYNFEDLQHVCRDYNPDVTLDDLIALASAYTYEDALARRGE